MDRHLSSTVAMGQESVRQIAANVSALKWSATPDATQVSLCKRVTLYMSVVHETNIMNAVGINAFLLLIMEYDWVACKSNHLINYCKTV